MTELIRALAAFAEAPAPEHARIAGVLGLGRPPTRAEHTELFLFQLYPYASVYAGPDGMLGGEGRDRVAGFWRALELTPPPEPDHLGALLGMYVELADAEAGAEAGAGPRLQEGGGPALQAGGGPALLAGLHRARAALLREHLACWVFAWLRKAEEVGAEPYREWAALLREVLLAELRELDGAEHAGSRRPDRDGAVGDAGGPVLAPPPTALPLHLREAPPLSDPRHGEGDFLAELLAPVRSGMILTRADLVRAGRELGLGVRIGERRYTMEALFSQDPGAVLEWLAAEAGAWVRHHGAAERELGPVGVFWRERAERAAALLEELAETAAKAASATAAKTAAVRTAAPTTGRRPVLETEAPSEERIREIVFIRRAGGA